MFLQLLVAQMQNQDPLNPTDSTQFVSQLAQFSQLEQTIGIHSDTDSIASYMAQAAQNDAAASGATSSATTGTTPSTDSGTASSTTSNGASGTTSSN